MKLRNILFLTLIFIITTSFVFCARKSQNNKPLVNTYWQLTHIEGIVVEHAPSTPCIQFMEDGTFNGNLGCNSFFGNYFAKKKKMAFDYVGSTKRYCQNMKIEDHFGKVIRNGITHYTIEGDTLFLRNKKNIVLQFIASTAPVEE